MWETGDKRKPEGCCQMVSKGQGSQKWRQVIEMVYNGKKWGFEWVSNWWSQRSHGRLMDRSSTTETSSSVNIGQSSDRASDISTTRKSTRTESNHSIGFNWIIRKPINSGLERSKSPMFLPLCITISSLWFDHRPINQSLLHHLFGGISHFWFLSPCVCSHGITYQPTTIDG